MTIEEFLEESSYGWEKANKLAELKEAYSDAETLEPSEWMKKWTPVIMSTPTLTADFYNSKLLSTTKPLPERLRESFGSSGKTNPFRKGKEWENQIYWSEFSDVPRETFDKTLTNMANYWDSELAESAHEAGKIRREREVKNWNPLTRGLLASEYEKARYIDDPKSAIFGDEAPPLGMAPHTRYGAAGDLALGVAGAAGDALPGVAAYSGPALRAARDVAHRASGSKYQKSKGEIASDFLSDVALTSPIALLPNFRREKRMFGNLGGKNLHEMIALENEAKTLTESANEMTGVLMNQNLNGAELNAALRETWRTLPDSWFKEELRPLINTPTIHYNEIAKKAAHARIDAAQATNPQMRQVIRESTALYDGNLTPRQFSPIQQRIINTRELTKAEQKMKPVFRFTDKFLTGELGGAALKEFKTATKTGTTEPATNDVDWYLANYTRDWDTLGFKPGKQDQKDGNPKWEAYKIWHQRKFGILPQED